MQLPAKSKRETRRGGRARDMRIGVTSSHPRCVPVWWQSTVVLLQARETSEKRYMVLGRINSQHWSAIITYRGAIIRIISVGRSTPREIEIYEKIAP